MRYLGAALCRRLFPRRITLHKEACSQPDPIGSSPTEVKSVPPAEKPPVSVDVPKPAETIVVTENKSGPNEHIVDTVAKNCVIYEKLRTATRLRRMRNNRR